MSARPRFSSAAAAAAAVAHGDGFKPREERGWEEFHPDMSIDLNFPIFSSSEIDGLHIALDTEMTTPRARGDSLIRHDGDSLGHHRTSRRPTPTMSDENPVTFSPKDTPRKRPGRPTRRPGSMLKGIGVSPEAPKVVPPPGFNPQEKLTLPKPSFRQADPFARFQEREELVNISMLGVGYQRDEMWAFPSNLIRVTEGNIEEDLISKKKLNLKDDGTGIGPNGVGRVEYDMDEQDIYWLRAYNEIRRVENVPEVKPWIFEVAMTKIEKEWHALEKRIPKPNPKPPQTHRPRSSSAAAVNGELAAHGEEQDTKCAICDDGDCENTNAIVFCDGCDLAVHQECYGVPFIPEGQWLCRKCQLIGRGTPTCIFCPNTDGAFKQTNASRWSHLLCAIWIPEVSIGNATFMEPVMDVEKVPKPRWKLTCYICRQKMGACIQCGNKNCYIAFHVTCARRARLFLKMKSTHGGPATLDASVLKAFCDKHVPAEWRREHDVDHAIVEAMDYYRHAMRGRLWADSQQSALTAVPPPPSDPYSDIPAGEEASNPKIILKLGTKNANKPLPPKSVWKLPSGAPVIPQALYNSIITSLQRFTIQKRKDFVGEVCKYWTLKREARRGAALLKRLQLQMETFTSMEIARRNFVGMGAAGRVRLQRRIDFAEALLEDVNRLRDISAKILERESQKLEDAKLLPEIANLVYFPLTPLLSPIISKAIEYVRYGPFWGTVPDRVRSDVTGNATTELLRLQNKVDTFSYESITDFVGELSAVLTHTLHLRSTKENVAISGMTNGNHPSKLKSNSTHAIAKRMIQAIQSPLEDATRRICQLSRTPPEDTIRRVRAMLDDSLSLQPASSMLSNGIAVQNDTKQSSDMVNGDDHQAERSNASPELQPADILGTSHKASVPTRSSARRSRAHGGKDDVTIANGIEDTPSKADKSDGKYVGHAPTRSNLNEEKPAPSTHLGIPWYMAMFHLEGTTIEEKPWEGRTLVRGEDLSDMDDEEMSGLVEGANGFAEDQAAKAAEALAAAKRKKTAARKRKRLY